VTRPPVLAALAVFAAYCAVAPFVPPADDELYYWCWSETLQWSYYDHPVMTALMIRAATTVFGDTLFAVRLPACVSTAVVFAVTLSLTRPRAVAWWLLATPLFTLGAVIVTPDTPLLMFWALYVLWLVAVHQRLGGRDPSPQPPPRSGEGEQNLKPESATAVAAPLPVGEGLGRGHGTSPIPVTMWLLGGVLLGCGVLGKYTTGLAVPAGFVAFLLAGRPRRWLGGYVLHGVVAFLVASPILIHNVRHDFAPLRYQWEHSMGTTDPSLKRFGEFVGLQILLFGTMPLVLFPWVLANARRLAADPRLRVCLCLYGLPYAFFLYKAARGPLEGNWALASYVAFWPLAADWYGRVRASRGWRIAAPLSFGLPAAAVVLVAVHLVHPLPVIPPLHDRFTRQADKFVLAARVADGVRALPERLPVYTDTYQWVALLRFHGVDARQVDGATRPSHFTQRPERVSDSDRALMFWEGPPPPPFDAGGRRELVAEYPLVTRGRLLAPFMLWRYTKDGTASAGPPVPPSDRR
jgi:4-amino-4-deoxy-L-arabinose transferase-like glycosyltransferase